MKYSLLWRHNEHHSVSNHQPRGCILNRLFRRRSKKTSKLRVTGLCVRNSPGPVNSPHKGPVTRKMFPFDDVIMCGRQNIPLAISVRPHTWTNIWESNCWQPGTMIQEIVEFFIHNPQKIRNIWKAQWKRSYLTFWLAVILLIFRLKFPATSRILILTLQISGKVVCVQEFVTGLTQNLRQVAR